MASDGSRAPARRDPVPVPVPKEHPPGGAASPRTDDSNEAASEPNAAVVVAAYVDGATNAGLPRPAGALLGRVGAQAKRLLAEGIPLPTLAEAATAMGAAGWNDLAVQLQRTAATRNGRASPSHQPFLNPPDDAYDLEKHPL